MKVMSHESLEPLVSTWLWVEFGFRTGPRTLSFSLFSFPLEKISHFCWRWIVTARYSFMIKQTYASWFRLLVSNKTGIFKTRVHTVFRLLVSDVDWWVIIRWIDLWQLLNLACFDDRVARSWRQSGQLLVDLRSELTMMLLIVVVLEAFLDSRPCHGQMDSFGLNLDHFSPSDGAGWQTAHIAGLLNSTVFRLLSYSTDLWFLVWIVLIYLCASIHVDLTAESWLIVKPDRSLPLVLVF